MMISANIMPVSSRFRVYIPKDKTKPTRIMHVWTKGEKHKVMSLHKRGFYISEIVKKMGPPFKEMMVRKQIAHLKKNGFSSICPSCEKII